VFLANYSCGNIKTNSIQPVSVSLAFFEMIWYFFHKWFGNFCSLEPGNPVVQTFHFALCRPICCAYMYSCLSYGCCMACKTPWVGMACDNPYSWYHV